MSDLLTSIEYSGNVARVTSSGELIVAPLQYADTKFNTLDVNDTAYHFFPPVPGKQFVISGAMVFADKDVADNTDTVIVIYEAANSTTITVDKVLLQFGMGQLTVLPMFPLNLLVNEGKCLNAKAGDTDIHMTIMGYYIKTLS